MIKFFRHIRQKLLNEGKSSKYLTYAIGEIALVVFGILIALQINNWNNDRLNVQKEIWYLDNIANDMFNQKSGLLQLKKEYLNSVSVSENLLLDVKVSKQYESIDSLSQKLNQLMTSHSYRNIDNTYREMVSSGQVSLIENDSLILEIIDFYIYSSEVEEMFKVNQDQLFFGEIFPVLNKYAQVDISDYTENKAIVFEDEEISGFLKNELKNSKNKLELTNAIRNKLKILHDFLITIEESLDEVNRIIGKIDMEIENLK
ncbi:DUF6090 family protein [Croceivirga thetidis]|uniref:DUF4134 domain-containing protein n=1 Tax=Croceivirga thetidis TaxID=2721623 RepID=A0ABX1GPC6_9FLAO|nr:DUF6090 family protein [Croceivirga thetidis]NKI30941.1 DUF4134 domain-containing protein [Croceivirga thetidis]